MLSVKLVVVGGEAKSKEMNLQLPTIIGRGREGVSLTLPHPLVSRKHTELFEEEGKLFVKDLGSLNGTFVNNRRIADQTPLEPNELLTLGNVTFRAVYHLGEAKHPVDESPIEAPVDVLDDREAKSDGSDTDKSIVVAEIEEVAPSIKIETAPHVPAPKGANQPAPMVSAAREKEAPKQPVVTGLPAAKEKVDFAFQLDGSASEAIKEVEINLDETGPTPVAGDSRLGSFLKKMPR